MADSKILASVLQELERLTSLASEPMAEFLISIHENSQDLNDFKKKLKENEAPFEDEFIEKIDTVINRFKGKKEEKQSMHDVKEEKTIDSIKVDELRNHNLEIKSDTILFKEEAKESAISPRLDFEPEVKKEAKKVERVDEFGRLINTKYERDNDIIEPELDHRPKIRRAIDNFPVEKKIYDGKISKIENRWAFVNLNGVKRSRSAFLHISEFSNARIDHPNDVVSIGDTVFVKVLSSEGGRVKVSMKNINQETAEEVTDINNDRGRIKEFQLKVKKKLTSPERWELRQLIASGAISSKDYPELDEDLNDTQFTTSGKFKGLREDDIEIDLEVKPNNPKFLQKGKNLLKNDLNDTSQIDGLKITPKLEGSLNRAAMTGSELAREMKEKKLRQLKEKRLAKLKSKENSLEENEEEESEWEKVNKNITYGKRTELPIDVQRKSLPVYKMRSELLKLVAENQFIVVVGETGSGKTTQLTQYLMEEGYSNQGIVGCTQPRRVAAKSVARRVAEEVGCKLGEEVGYNIRFEDVSGPNTRIKYMTDGMLQREALVDPNMSKYSVIMLDEAHERTIATDVLFALLKKAAKNRPDLKLIITSATLDSQKFSKYFNNCPILNVPGRTYPVEILYTKEPELDYLAASLDTILQIHVLEKPGDILVFLTGQEEIELACEALYEKIKNLGPSVSELIILPVYSSLPSEVQSRIFEPTPQGSRKCVIATNIAETSITIDGIKYVVDPGFVKLNVYDPKLGMDSLVVSPISQAQANQRSGRAGRTGPGKCFRLYTENAFKNEMAPNTIPEIQRQNLSNTILMLKAMGVEDLIGFDFMDPPPIRTMIIALENLLNLNALDTDGNLTNLGKKMADFPMDPELAKALIFSISYQCSEELTTIVAMLSVPNIFFRPRNKQQQADLKKAKFHSVQGDHLTLLNVYNTWKQNDYRKSWCEENFIQDRALNKARDVKKQLIKIFLRRKMEIYSCGRDLDRVRVSLCSGFFKNSAKKDSSEPGAYKTLHDDTPVYLHPSSALFGKKSEFVIYHTLVLTTKEYMHYVTNVEPKWLVEVAPNFFKIADGKKKSGKIVSLKASRKIAPPSQRG